MTTIIDLSSDDETPPAPKPQGMSVASTQQHKTYQRVRKQQHCQASKTQPIEIKDDNLSQLRLHQKDLDFIDHVVMIWLHRARKGYKNIEMPDDILKAKANEAVNVMKLDKSLFCENTWIMGFHEKLKKLKESKQMIEYGKSKMFKIEAIIDAENSSFYRNYDENKFKETKRLLKETHKEKLAQELKEIEDTQQKQLENMLQQQKKHLEWVKEAQKQQIARIKYA
ncbi:uncharacterized protein LOC129946162 [Eupeodes corollae]|uniref:uncharacterized protein LOC129946162 n=1 Tax=Eupeodes corollae TaxID=290404 RepID=UPI00249218A4|nr:uncharacterized protein LOC129946162 [Eupeodes corollae]